MNNLGPCYDFCMCRYCWNGWIRLTFWQRLRYRVEQIIRQRSFD